MPTQKLGYRLNFFPINLVMSVCLLLSIVFLICPIAHAEDSGKDLFVMHCSGCHVNGGNIIRRGKTLKLPALKRNGLDNQDSIARVAREGVGSMSGYKEVLGKGGDQLVAIWILEQAQKAWVQG